MASLVAILIFFVLVFSWAASRAAWNRREILRRILGRIDGQFVSPGLLSRGLVHAVEGRHMGRDLTLRVTTRPRFPFRGMVYPMTAKLALHHAPDISLRIRHDRGLAAVEKAAGLVRDLEVAGGGRFDQKYLVEADDAPAHAPLADENVRRAVDELLVRWDLDEIRIQRGKLVVKGDSRRLGQRMLRGLLEELEVLAHAYDRRPALDLGLKERFFWVGGSDNAPRCPFCHDTLETEEKVDVSSCGLCQTLIHSECFAENGGCPILGCGGRGVDHLGPLMLKE